MSKELKLSSVLDKHLSPIEIDGATVPIEISTDSVRFNEDATFQKDVTIEGDLSILGNQTNINLTDDVMLYSSGTTGFLNLQGLGLTVFANLYSGDGDSTDNDAMITLHSSDGYDSGIKLFNTTTLIWTIGRDGSEANELKFDWNAGVGAATKLELDSSGNTTQEGSISIKEKASAIADTAAYGQLWVKDEAPCELYFTTDAGDDIQLTDGTSAAGGGGGSDTYCFSTTARCRNQYNNWYHPNSLYGMNYYYWLSSTGSTGLPLSYVDSNCPGFIVPKDGTVKSYTIIGNLSTTDTWEWALMKGAQPTYGSAGNYTMSNAGATQSAGGTANILYKWEQTGLSTAVNAGDMLLPYFRRTTDNDSSYSYCEMSMSILMG